jgi:hypothetical protein
VLVNSEHFLHMLVFDREKHVSLNSTSLAVKIRSSDEKLASVFYVVKGEKDEGFSHYQHSVVANVYDKRRVLFKDVPGTVILEAQVEGYFNRVLSDVSQSIINQDTAAKPQHQGSYFSSFLWTTSEKAKATESISESVADYFSFIGGAVTPLPSKLQNQMRIEIVKNVDLEPKFKSLYLGPTS